MGDSNPVSVIPGNDLRLVESCIKVLAGRSLMVPSPVETAAEGARRINEFVTYNGWNRQDVKLLLDEARQRILPIEELDWFRGNERACYWVWFAISQYYFYEYPNPPVIEFTPDPMPATVPSYSQLELKSEPSSSEERFDEVVKFFDKVNQPLDWQEQLVATLKSQWALIFSLRKPFSWLKPDDEEQIRWAWEYLGKFNSVTSKPILLGFAPTGSKEMYLAIYAAFDSWNTSYDTKRLFLNDFNKAWNQKKHRDSRQGKKVCNLVLREEVKQKLDDLAERRGKKLNQLVEELIENEYAIEFK